MSDFAIAGIILMLLVGLAVAAPIWGADSRDGIESDQSARRVAWLQGGQSGSVLGRAQVSVGAYAAGVAMAGMLRSAARRIDAEAADGADLERQVVPA